MLSIVILTCNSQRFLRECLDSVFVQGPGKFEVIVVDNGSTDGTREILRQNKSRIRLIENEKNFGTSKARNQGIECAAGNWVLCLDSDVVLEKNFVKNFFAAEKELSPRGGMLQPNVLSRDGRTIYSQGIHLSSLRRFFDRNRGKLRDFSEGKKAILGACSAAAFYRRSMLEDIRETTGYFDERFFFLVEDVDLAWRACRKGWETLFEPSMVCFHAGDSSATHIKLRQYLSFRNRYWMIKKNEPGFKSMLLWFVSWPYEVTRWIWMAFTNRYFWTGYSAGK